MTQNIGVIEHTSEVTLRGSVECQDSFIFKAVFLGRYFVIILLLPIIDW